MPNMGRGSPKPLMSMRSELNTVLSGSGGFADGKTANSERVTVHLTDRGVEINPGTGEPLLWPYGTLESGIPLSRRANHDAIITCKSQPGATLFLDDPALILALVQRAPHLSSSGQRCRWALPVIGGVALVLLLAFAISFADERPATVIAGWIPQESGVKLGRQVIDSLTTENPTCNHAPGVRALDELVKRLQRGTNGAHFDVRVVDWDVDNAFAVPGGQIVVARGLLAATNGPDELAAVIAHEMGHGLKLHPEAGIVRSFGMSAIFDLTTGGGGMFSSFGAYVAEMSYSRDAEREADATALELLRATAISARGLASFFKRAEEPKTDTDNDRGNAETDRKWSHGFEILSSHPLTEDRIAAARNAPTYPSTPALTRSQWQALKAICTSKVK